MTPGGWDLRATADALPWPKEPLTGLRCLDIGTMDGFWAFELERRGAGEVLATDVLDAARLDRFPADQLRGRLGEARLGAELRPRRGAARLTRHRSATSASTTSTPTTSASST